MERLANLVEDCRTEIHLGSTAVSSCGVHLGVTHGATIGSGRVGSDIFVNGKSERMARLLRVEQDRAGE